MCFCCKWLATYCRHQVSTGHWQPHTRLHIIIIQKTAILGFLLVTLTGAVVDSTDKNGCTALHIAALYGHELLSGTLLMFRADPSKRGYEGTLD
jgi:ankyrin repeat protein